MTARIAIALLLICLSGCRSHRYDTYYKAYETDKQRGGLYVYWIENKPVSNRYGVCAEVYSQWGHFDGKYEGKWGGENHRKDAQWDAETKSHVGFAEFKNQRDAEAWGDKLCAN
jgi:hypothetical protein